MFLLQRIPKSDVSSLSYLLGCGGKGKAIAVDVFAEDVHWFIAQAEKKAVAINFVIDTHVHADHISGGKALAAKSGAHYCLYELAQTEFPFKKLQDGEILNIGNVTAQVVHTPGHTFDSICLLITDRTRSPDAWFLLTGHTLFVGSVGRPDLAGYEQEMVQQLYDSISKKILTLPEYVEIYPGAQAGSVCGVGLSGKPSSTLFFEKKFNKILSTSKEDFIKAVLAELPSKPAGMSAIIKENMQGYKPVEAG